MVLNLAYNKNKPYKTSACWSKKFLNFGFLEKGLGIVFLSNLCTIFQEKYLSCNFIAWLPLRLEILVNMCSAIFRWKGCDFMNFENNFIFLIRSLLYTTKKYRQKIKYLENKESIKSEVNSIFLSFSRGFQLPKLSQTWECFKVLYATFKMRKFESLFYKINTCLEKTTICIGLQVEQISSVMFNNV